ncbi:thiol reductant ABC exporter subunit CydC [Corynebacterium sphenisci]|uniref:thiol reductant ABC exporter subunit CydC n=1 Tax=Corynebacterium sphenisci TaxID=191493 RepID=UPI0009520859|nr:thiol reductant ABC exporter subunit CydC [Corynebacterium sphenisci]
MIRAVLAGTLTLLASIGLTATSAWLITRAWQMPPVLDLAVAVTAVRALGISRAVFRYVDRLAAHDLALRRAERARAGAYAAVAAAPPERVAGLTRGALLTRLGADVDALTEETVRARVPARVALATSAVAVAGVAAASPAAAAVLAAGLAAAGLAAPALAARAERRSGARRARATQDHVAAVDRVLADAAVLRVRGTLPEALAEADRAARRLAAAEEPDAAAAGLAAASATWTVAGVLAVVLAAGPQSPQWVGVLALLPLAAFEAVAGLPAAAVTRERARAARSRLAGLAGADEPAPAAPGAPAEAAQAAEADPEPRLRARGLELIRGSLGTVDLDLPFGSRLRVTAPSGAGKTTLLLTLAGLLPAAAGRVRPGGDRITCITEDAHVFATTIRDNLALGAPEATDAEMAAVLAAVGLGDWLAGLPRGLATVLAGGAGDLSGGQRRRLLLARALLTESPILLLDEPDEHLDDAGAAALERLLAAPELPGARPRRTVVVASHPRFHAGLLPVRQFPA